MDRFKKNKLIQIMEKRRAERERIKQFNKSEEGKALHKKVHDMHNKEITDINEVPF